LISDHDH
jgi:transposase